MANLTGMGKVVSLGQIAEVTGLSKSTISRALRHEKCIPEPTRARVHEAAKKLGYQPDGALRVAMKQLRHSHDKHYQATLAILHRLPRQTTLVWRNSTKMLDAAREHARALGFGINDIEWLEDISSNRLADILHQRNISGLLLFGMQETGFSPNETALISQYPAVSMGVVLQKPTLNAVYGDLFACGRMAGAKILDRGYRRPGMITDRKFQALTHHQYTGGAAAAIASHSDHIDLPMLQLTRDEPIDTDQLNAWVKAYQLDSIIVTLSGAYAELQQSNFLEKHRLGIAGLSIDHEEDPGLSGVCRNESTIGKTAVEHLVELLEHDISGPDQHQRCVIIEPSWVEGDSLPAKE